MPAKSYKLGLSAFNTITVSEIEPTPLGQLPACNDERGESLFVVDDQDGSSVICAIDDAPDAADPNHSFAVTAHNKVGRGGQIARTILDEALSPGVLIVRNVDQFDSDMSLGAYAVWLEESCAKIPGDQILCSPN